MKKRAMVIAVLILAGGASGCRTTASSEGAAGTKAPARQEKPEKKVSPSVPASSPLAKIQNGMRRAQVYDLLGEPTSTRAFPSAKAFNPFYYGPDSVRTGAFYKGLGRVVFSGAGIVVQVEYDPAEDGY